MKHQHEMKMNSFPLLMLSCIEMLGLNNGSMASRVANMLTSNKWGEGASHSLTRNANNHQTKGPSRETSRKQNLVDEVSLGQ
jgi:hypothetical protein